MPRGKKKTEQVTTVLNNEKNKTETSAEIAAPVSVKSEQPKKTAETSTEKPKSKAGRKPKADASKATKNAAASKSETEAKATASADTDKPKNKAGRKPKTEKAVAAETPKADKKATGNEKKTPAKRGRKPSNNTSKNAVSVPAPADTVSITTEKPKRTYTKKAKSTSTKTAKTEDVIIQSSGNEYSMSDITEMCKNDYRGGTRKQIKSIKVYIKAENNVVRAYYVVNDSASGHIDL